MSIVYHFLDMPDKLQPHIDAIFILMSTLDDSYCTRTTEIVQAIKSVEENINDSKEMKIWDQTMYL